MTAFACLFNPFANTFLWMNSFPNELPLFMQTEWAYNFGKMAKLYNEGWVEED